MYTFQSKDKMNSLKLAVERSNNKGFYPAVAEPTPAPAEPIHPPANSKLKLKGYYSLH